MLAHDRVVLLELELTRGVAAVLHGGVEEAGSSAALQADLLPGQHIVMPPLPDLARLHFPDHRTRAKVQQPGIGEENIPVPTAQEIVQVMSPSMQSLLQEFYAGEDLPYAAEQQIDFIAGQFNLTPDQLINIVGEGQ